MDVKLHKPEEYRWIRRWGNLMGSYDYYIVDQQHLASKENAPVNAIYQEHGTNRWATIDEVDNPSTRLALSQMFPGAVPESWKK